ncbi:MAG TPA: hypothetical protein VFX60_19580 [Micromonospora sp.]|nr:hypothetical protein [Micromonospora sp.]
MSYPPVTRRRPTTVTAAASLMILMALVGLIYAVVSLSSLNGIVDRFRAAAARTDARQADIEALIVSVRSTTIIALLFGVMVALLLLLLAIGILQGSNAVRIATWVISGLGLICGSCSLGVVVLQRMVPLVRQGENPELAELIRALTEAYPSWWIPLSGALSAAQAFGYLVVAVLLAMPATNAFFRRRPPAGWRPPMPPHMAPPPPL